MGWLCGYMAGWLACYVAACVAGCSWVARYELASLWLAWLPATWWLMADEMAGCPCGKLLGGWFVAASMASC